MSSHNNAAHFGQDDLKALYGQAYVQEFNLKQSV